MILKVFIMAVILLAISTLGIGLKLLRNRSSKEEVDVCKNDTSQSLRCGCGGGLCEKTIK